MTAKPPVAGHTGTRLLHGTGPGLGPTAESFRPSDRTLLHVLARRAQDQPERDWLVFDGADRLTFGDAWDTSRRVAGAIAATQLDSPTVGLFLRNQLEFVPALFGAQLAGGLPAPLNPELRGQLLETLIERCHAQLLVTRADLLDELAEAPGLGDVQLIIACGGRAGHDRVHGIPVVTWDSWCGSTPPAPPPPSVPPSELAALMFTSGTSGGSKAAMWPHQYLYLTSAGIVDSMGLTRDDVLSTPLQMCHIAGLQNFANAALQAGCTAHLKSRFSARTWWEEIAADGATFSMLMGQMAAMILSSVPEAPRHRLGHVYILPQPAEREEFEKRYQTTVVWQGWGMTEIFPHPPGRRPIDGVPADTIGPPPSWVEYGVVDQDDRLLPPDTMGEMVYRPLIPNAMAIGYYGDPEATEEAFRGDMFHTGDLGYYDEQGMIHFVMRNQDAIRRRGENISAVELENVARQHPQVIDAAAYAVPSELGEHEVKLDLIATDELGSLDDLHRWLSSNLPRFMVPRYLELREDFPRTTSQRVEKYKLAGRPLDRPDVREFAPPPRRP